MLNPVWNGSYAYSYPKLPFRRRPGLESCRDDIIAPIRQTDGSSTRDRLALP